MTEQTSPTGALGNVAGGAQGEGQFLAVPPRPEDARGAAAPYLRLTGTESYALLDHVADQTRRYPGEQVTFFTRVEVNAPLAGFELRVRVPAGLEIEYYQAVDSAAMPQFFQTMEAGPQELVMLPGADGEPFPVRVPQQPTRAVEPMRPAQELVWRVAESQPVGAVHEFQVKCVTLPVHQDALLFSTATLLLLDARGGILATAPVSLTVSLKVLLRGRYLAYLPALYEQDSFMARFLMLFESFWDPIEQQIGSISEYFDPDMTPARFLPWLASWFDLTLDENWSEAQQRELLNAVVWLYRRRGTRAALQRYLEILTGGPVEILERRAKNMNLGRSARLGIGVALGTGNMPHTFTVRVQLAPLPAPERLTGRDAEQEAARREKMRRDLIHRIIQSEKPAHTSYRLEILSVPPASPTE